MLVKASTIFVHDDGPQLLGDADREARISFYADHNIGWVARPPHDNSPDGFKRAGRFKKASNMNYRLRLSLKLENHLAELEAVATNEGDECLEDQAMKLAIEEKYEETDKRFKPWTCNGRSLRIGEIILIGPRYLIVDSDTVVPEVGHRSVYFRVSADGIILLQDCLRDAARELAESPEVAIIQHESGNSHL